MKIPIFNLTRQYKNIEQEINNAILSTVRSGMFILGPKVAAFEKSFAAFVRIPYAIAVGSGTDALTLSLKALDITNGDEIIIPANAYPSAFGLSLTGACIKLIDVGNDGNLDPALLSAILTKKTRAVIPVHLYGNPANIPAIKNILRYSKISLIEDCAQAHGAKINGQHVGTFGSIGCFSFYPSKNLGAYGDGGMLVTANKLLAQKLQALRMYGEIARYQSIMVSGVSRLDEIHAAVLEVKLKYLAAWNARRKKIAEQYMRALEGTGDIRFIQSNYQSTHHLFVIRTKQRDDLQTHLAKHGIQTAIHYPTPIHLTKSFKYLGYKKGDFPVSEALSDEVLSLPLFPELTQNEQETVILYIKNFYK